jgi:hypothetical protein
MNFNKRVLDKFDLSMEEKKSFIENLESISGNEILDRIEEVNYSYDSISNKADEIYYKKRKENNKVIKEPKTAPKGEYMKKRVDYEQEELKE